MVSLDILNEKLKDFASAITLVHSIQGKSIKSKELAGFIDHTLLKADAHRQEIINLCQEAKKYGFTSVCVNPCNVELAAKKLFGSTVKVCSVVGFPLGANETSIKLDETELALTSGAKEIDMVINIGKLKDDNQNYVFTEILSIAQICHKNNALLKVIIETAVLTDLEKVLACMLAIEAKADFVKTSTGFSKSGANIRDVALMKFVVAEKAKVKASGGIKNYEDAVLMILNGASRLGTSSGVNIIEKSISTADY